MNIYLQCANFLEQLEDYEGIPKPVWFIFWENYQNVDN